MKRVLLLWGVLVFALVGCDDGGDDGAADAGSDAGAESGWASLDFDGRLGYMAQTVLPQMQQVFADYDPAYADSFGCATCHGSDLSAYAMPSDISTLSADELATFTFEGEGRQEIANAMAATVLPRMAELLGQEPFDPETNTGTFGCAGCHVVE